MADSPSARPDAGLSDMAVPAPPRVIALVDDDRNILTTLSIALQTEGFATRVYNDGTAALKALLDNPPALAIFDIKMPRMDGLELLQKLRAQSSVPVIFLTSKDDEADEAMGLSMGADDYIAKPFSQRLLIARIRAILRRSEIVQSGAAEDAEAEGPALPEPIRRGSLTMDPARHQVAWNGEPVSLTVTEFLILESLAIRPGVVKTRNQLMDAAYHDDVFVDDRTIDSHIKRLRRKFREVDLRFGTRELEAFGQHLLAVAVEVEETARQQGQRDHVHRQDARGERYAARAQQPHATGQRKVSLRQSCSPHRRASRSR